MGKSLQGQPEHLPGEEVRAPGAEAGGSHTHVVLVEARQTNEIPQTQVQSTRGHHRPGTTSPYNIGVLILSISLPAQFPIPEGNLRA